MLLCKKLMKLRNMVIPVELVGVPQCDEQVTVRRVHAADDYLIPSMSEALIDAFVDRSSHEDDSGCTALVEGVPNFTEETGLVVAPALCDIENNATVRVRLINLFDNEVSIKQDTSVGIVHNVDSITGMAFPEEDPDEIGNLNYIRRVALPPALLVPDVAEKADLAVPICLPEHVQER